MQTCVVSLKTRYSYSIVLLIMPGDSWLLVVYVWWVLPGKLSDTQFHPIPRSVLQMLRCNFLNRPNVPTETHPEPSARAMHCSAVAVFLSTLLDSPNVNNAAQVCRLRSNSAQSNCYETMWQCGETQKSHLIGITRNQQSINRWTAKKC